MPPSRLDAVYRSILLTKFFTKGWGNPKNLKRIFEFRKIIGNRNDCYKLIPRNYPVTITKDEEWYDCHIIEGQFETPFDKHVPNIMPEEVKIAYFQVVLPKQWSSNKIKPICLQYPGTGDHYFWRRRNIIAKPLLRESGIASIIIENPFYGLRKPKDQVRSSLQNVSDIFIMGGCLILESIVILNWCEQQGFAPVGLTGLSMGGHMASLAAANWPKPIPLIPCLSWSTASPVFTKGVMSASVNWSLLESQILENKDQPNSLAEMVKIISPDDAYEAGQEFVKNYPESMSRINKIRKETSEKSSKTKSGKSSETDDKKSHEFDKKNTNSCEDEENDLKSNENEKINAKSESEENGYSDEDKENINSDDDQAESNNTEDEKRKGFETVGTDSSNSEVKKKGKHSRQPQALHFMKGIMDECTHLQNFDIPVDTELIIAVCARDDAYVPRRGTVGLEEIWPQAEIRYVNAGHVSAYVLYQKMFRSTIAEAFQKYLKKYPMDDI